MGNLGLLWRRVLPDTWSKFYVVDDFTASPTLVKYWSRKAQASVKHGLKYASPEHAPVVCLPVSQWTITDCPSLLTFADRDVLGHQLLLTWMLAREVRTQREETRISFLHTSLQCWNDHPALLPLDGQSPYSNIHFSNFLIQWFLCMGVMGSPGSLRIRALFLQAPYRTVLGNSSSSRHFAM